MAGFFRVGWDALVISTLPRRPIRRYGRNDMTSNDLTRTLAVTAARYWADRLRRTIQQPGAGIDPDILKAVQLGPPGAIALLPIWDRLHYAELAKLTEELIRAFESEFTEILEAEMAQCRSLVIRNEYEPDRLVREALHRCGFGRALTLFPIGSAMHIFLPGSHPLAPCIYVRIPGEETDEPLSLISE